MAESIYLQWTSGGKKHGYSAVILDGKEHRCRAFILKEFDMLTTGAKNATRRERREWRRQPYHSDITKVEVGIIVQDSKGKERKILRSWAA